MENDCIWNTNTCTVFVAMKIFFCEMSATSKILKANCTTKINNGNNLLWKINLQLMDCIIPLKIINNIENNKNLYYGNIQKCVRT